MKTILKSNYWAENNFTLFGQERYFQGNIHVILKFEDQQ